MHLLMASGVFEVSLWVLECLLPVFEAIDRYEIL